MDLAGRDHLRWRQSVHSFAFFPFWISHSANCWKWSRPAKSKFINTMHIMFRSRWFSLFFAVKIELLWYCNLHHSRVVIITNRTRERTHLEYSPRFFLFRFSIFLRKLFCFDWDLITSAAGNIRSSDPPNPIACAQGMAIWWRNGRN